MATEKKRTIHFFQPVRVKPDDSFVVLKPQFWQKFRAIVEAKTPSDQFVKIRGVEYRGAARTSMTSEYLYLGKTRDAIDYPDSGVGSADEAPLVLVDGGRLVEPCYILPFDPVDNVVATLRSSGGASISAVSSWLTEMVRSKDGSSLRDDRIELRPIIRHDQELRLAQATSVVKFSAKIAPHESIPTTTGATGTAGALATIYDELDRGAMVNIEMSYGVSQPDDAGGARFLDQVKRILGWNVAKAASATIIRPDENGELVRDYLDFVKEKVTLQEVVGVGLDGGVAITPTPDIVLDAMRNAVRRYQSLDIDPDVGD